MLNFNQRTSLLKLLKPRIIGYKESEKEREKLIKCIKELSENLMEKENITKVSKKYLLPTYNMDLSTKIRCRLGLPEVKFQRYGYYAERQETSVFYKINFKTPVYLGDFLDNPERLCEKYPDLFKSFTSTLKKLIETRNTYESNLESIMKVLEIKELNITAIKKNFPELYKDFKENGTD